MISIIDAATLFLNHIAKIAIINPIVIQIKDLILSGNFILILLPTSKNNSTIF